MTGETLKKFWKKTDRLDKGLLIFFVIGAILVINSLFRGILAGRQVQIEYLESDKTTDLGRSSGILVDIEGAVISPGVYQLPADSRIKDLLVLAGGYSELADRSYGEKNLNLAQVLKDGQKIYIPELSDTPGNPGYGEAKTTANKVNVNVASVSELDTLWGVGPARAETIVKNRPYATMEELISKGGMTKQIYEKNQEMISLY